MDRYTDEGFETNSHLPQYGSINFAELPQRAFHNFYLFSSENSNFHTKSPNVVKSCPG